VQYTRNMATGASTADLAIILADAYRGFTMQSRRHAYIAALLGIRHIVIAVNKMDLVDYDEQVFNRIRAEFTPVLDQMGIRDAYFLPVSALKGDNIVDPSVNMPWFAGPALLEHLETVGTESHLASGSFRMPVQRVSRPDQFFRGYAGQIVSGAVRVGDEIAAGASGLTTRVKRIVTFDGDLDQAHAPMSVTLTLEDEIDISRGDLLTSGAAPRSLKSFDARIVWFNPRALDLNSDYLLKHGSETVAARIETIQSRVSMETLEEESTPEIKMNDIGRVRIRASREIFADSYRENRATGSFILIDKQSNATVAGGMIL